MRQSIPGRIGPLIRFRDGLAVQCTSSGCKPPQPEGLCVSKQVESKVTGVLFVKVPHAFASADRWQAFSKSPKLAIATWGEPCANIGPCRSWQQAWVEEADHGRDPFPWCVAAQWMPQVMGLCASLGGRRRPFSGCPHDPPAHPWSRQNLLVQGCGHGWGRVRSVAHSHSGWGWIPAYVVGQFGACQG